MHELKWQPEQVVDFSVLGEGGAENGSVGAARIQELSGRRLRITTTLPVRTGAAVRLEWDGQLVLGEVLNTVPEGFWMEIHHVLFATEELKWQKMGWQR
jgi:hypothetical protein